MSKVFKWAPTATYIKPVINRGSRRKSNKKMSTALNKAWRDSVLHTTYDVKSFLDQLKAEENDIIKLYVSKHYQIEN